MGDRARGEERGIRPPGIPRDEGHVRHARVALEGTPHLSAGVLGLCLLLQPLLAYVWDMLLFGTRLDTAGLVGLGLSLVGIFLGLTRGSARKAADATAA